MTFVNHELWQQFETLEADGLSIVKKMAICNQIAKASNDEDEKLHAELENRSLYFVLMMHHQLSHLEQFDKAAILSEIQRFTNADSKSDYYQARHQRTSNVFDKWRYAFCYWILQKEYDFLLQAIGHLFDAHSKKLEQQDYLESVFLLVKIFNLCRFYNILTTSTEIRARIIGRALDVINAVSRTPHARWMIEPSEILALIKNSIPSEQAGILISSLSYEANVFRINKNYHLFRSLIEASIGLCDFLSLTSNEATQLKRTMQLQIAESYVEEGDKRLEEDGAFAAVIFYQDAIIQYRKINEQSKIDELNIRIRSLNSQVLNEMDVIETRLELPKLQFKAETQNDLVQEILQHTSASLPSRRQVEQNVKQALKENPLSLTGRNVTFGGRNPISYDSDELSIIEANVSRELNWRIQIADQYLASAIAELESNNRITSEGYCQFISDSGLLDKSLFNLIAHGIEKHFDRDYVSSIHVLIPQIEATLRSLVIAKGGNTLKTIGDVIMDNELGGLLRNPETRAMLGEDLATYMEIKLVGHDGINLRNEVAHGLLQYEKFVHSESLAAIRIILLLNKLSVNSMKH